MPSYSQYLRQMAIMDAQEEDITWITVKGNHIPIKNGQNKGEAIKEFFESKKSGGEKKAEASTNKHDQLKKMGKEIVEHRKKWNEANELVDKGAFKDKTESHKEAIKRSGEELAKKEKEYEKLHAELTGGEKKQDKGAKSLKHHEDLDRMLESVMAYGGHTMSPEDILSDGYHGQFLQKYVAKYGEEEVKEAIKDMQSKIDSIKHDVYTDSEGVSYNSIVWKKDPMLEEEKRVQKYHEEEENAEADFKKLRSSFGSHYDKLYNDIKLDNESDYLLREWDKHIEDPKFKKQVQKFVEARGDFISSDREVKAFMLAAKEHGLIPDEKVKPQGGESGGVKREKSPYAQVASLIKKDLAGRGYNAKAYSKSYSGGDSVHVNVSGWYSKKIQQELQKEYGKYQQGSINPYEDYYEYNNTRNDIPQTKYLFVDFDRPSDEDYKTAEAYYRQHWHPEDVKKYDSMADWEKSRHLNDMFMAERTDDASKRLREVSEWAKKNNMPFGYQDTAPTPKSAKTTAPKAAKQAPAAKAESSQPADIMDWNFNDVMKLPISDNRVVKYIAKNHGLKESTVATLAEAFGNTEDLYMMIDRVSDKKGYGWDA